MSETLVAVPVEPSAACSNHHISDGTSQHKRDFVKRDNPGVPGKRHLHAPTREAQRLAWLLQQLYREGLSQADVARRTGIGQSHLSAIQSVTVGGNRGIGAHIVRLVRDGLRIHPDYFYDDYEGEVDHKVYSLSEKREERRFKSIEKAQADQARQLAEVTAKLADYGRLAAENLEKDQRIAELERALARATKRRA